MNNNQLSIVIPTYNERERIEKLIDFLLANDSKKLLEIIIVNAKESEDKLKDITIPPKVQVINSEMTCRAKQLQLGSELSKGGIIYFLHADTFPPKRYIEHIFKSTEVCDFGMFNYQFDEKKWNLKFNGWMTQWKGFYTGGGDQGLFIKNEAFNKVKGFDTDLIVMEDYDLFWKLKKARLRYKIIKDPAMVSARKYHKNNSLKVNLVNLVALIGFRFTGNSVKWGAFYKRYIK
jgi:GT2 family glycosyltransferase